MPGVIGTADATRVLTARELMRDRVVNAQGEDLGRIDDFLIDLTRGCIAYAVLECGGLFGLGEKLFAVPWHALTVADDDRELILNIDQDRLRGAPGFDKDRRPVSGDADYLSAVDRFYGTTR